MHRPRKILIVEDDPFNVDVLEQRLEQLGYQTESANNGREALDKVAISLPDLILLDVMMPVMDGLTTCRLLKEQEATRLIPIVIMTALHATEDRVKGKEAGARDFLTKPVDDAELRAVITTALKETVAREAEIDKARKLTLYYEHFVPAAVKRLVEENPDAPALGKREQDASILFVDICSYTKLSEQLSPNELNRLGETYFSAFLDPIYACGGDITETAGDGLMIVFYRSDPQTNAHMAVEAALELQRVTDRVNETSGGPRLAMHMGINSGIASVGTTVYEGKQGTRWVFTAGGLVTSLAARLLALAQPGQILVGPLTAERLTGSYSLTKVGREWLKNISEPVDVYSVSGPEGREESPVSRAQ
jgi:CheY-like chemotaxis protein